MRATENGTGRPVGQPLVLIRPGDGDSRHGTQNGYINLQCKCPECKAAHASYRRELRRRRREAVA